MAMVTPRGTLLLGTVLVALAGYLWLGDSRSGSPRPVAAEPPALLAVPASQITRVELEEKERTVVAVRGPAGWVDADGHPWVTDAVSDVVDTLTSLHPVMVVDPQPENLGDYGLDDGAVHLRLYGADKRVMLSLELGERNPAWTGVYARVDRGREVVLIGAVLHFELEKLRDAAP
jgi:hypothetical protein